MLQAADGCSTEPRANVLLVDGEEVPGGQGKEMKTSSISFKIIRRIET
jgi:hypothetical protein